MNSGKTAATLPRTLSNAAQEPYINSGLRI